MYIERDAKEKFAKVSSLSSIVAVVGARQAGKTTFLKEQMKNIQSNYVLFDDPDARKLFENDIKKFELQYISGYETTVLDELQYCRDAGIKLKYLADTGRKIWLTSSSEIILGKEILSYLVGRVSVIRLYPFSLHEFLAAKNQKEFTNDVLERYVWEHMTYGGYPKVVLTDDIEMKKTILKDLHDTMLLKDVAKTFSISDIRMLEEFARYMAINIGNMLSYESISNDIKISFQTVRKYLDAMEKSYLLVRIQPFFTNKIKEITKRPKLFFVDTGMRNILTKTFQSEPDGKLFENYVLTELIKMGFEPKYWRTKSRIEVDFIIEKDGEIIPIEVKLNAKEGRIERGMRSFIETYKPKTAFVVSYHETKKETVLSGCRIVFTNILNLRKMLLKE